MKNFTINTLRENRAAAWEKAKTFLDAHRTENGTLSAEDAAQYDQMEAEIVALGKEIERLERGAAFDAELSRPVSAPLTGKPGIGVKDKTGRASDEYKSAMLAALRSNFRNVSNVLQEGVDASGGYLVPVEYDTRLTDRLTDENSMRALGTVITTSGEHKINIAGNKPAAAWIEEGGALTFGDATFSQVILDAHKLHVAIKVTEELLYGLDDYIQEGNLLAWKIIFSGNFKGGSFAVYFGKAIRNYLCRLFRDFSMKNLICIGQKEDDHGNVTSILVEAEFAQKYREKQRERSKRYYEKKKAEAAEARRAAGIPDPVKKPPMSKEERSRKVCAWQKQYYREHPDKLEERRAKMRAYEKERRARIKMEKIMAAMA